MNARRWLARAAWIGGGVAAVGFLVAASGVVPLAASSRHWAVTHWFLDFGKRRSVATHTLLADAPDLSEPWLVLKGAGHYEGGCSPCHGSPVLHRPRIAAAMTPAPPHLPSQLARWEPEELAYIVEHGIKFTGMPAWPARGRSDEVRAVVAFLRALPDLDADGYRRLVFGDVPPPAADTPLRTLDDAGVVPRAVLASCARCHGVDGGGRGNAAFPRLAGQRVEYLANALAAYAAGARPSGIMEPIAAGLSAEDRREVARYYGALEPVAPAAPAAPAAPEASAEHAARIERGRELALHGVPARGVPACIDCHGPWPAPRNAAYPELAGQFAPYLELQLELFADGRRGGSPFAHLMDHVAPRLTPEQRRDAAAYYASLPPASGRTPR